MPDKKRGQGVPCHWKARQEGLGAGKSLCLGANDKRESGVVEEAMKGWTDGQSISQRPFHDKDVGFYPKCSEESLGFVC